MSAGSSRTMKTSVGVEKANFFVHYECDDETVKHVLKLDGYDGDEEECWVLLEQTPASAANAAAAEEGGGRGVSEERVCEPNRRVCRGSLRLSVGEGLISYAKIANQRP